MRKYGIVSNVKYVYKEAVKPKHMRLFLVSNFFANLFVPLLATVISSLVVYALTNGFSPLEYILLILGLCALSVALQITMNVTFTRYSWENTFTRCGEFWNRLGFFQITVDYANIEPKPKQKVVQKAFEAISSNWVGVEQTLKQFPLFLINVVGMIVYAVIVGIYVPYVLIVLAVMSVANFFLVKHANDYFEKRHENLNDAYNEKYYLSKQATSLEYGKDVRTYRLEKWFNALFNELTKSRFSLTKSCQKRYLYSQLSDSIFLFVRDAIAYSLIVSMVLNHEIEVSYFVFLIGIVAGFTTWLNGAVESFNELRKCNIAVDDYRGCLDTENVFNHGEGVDINGLSKPLKIEFRDVSFTYPEAEKPTIEHLSFTVKGGEKVALVGNNGAGKTTIIKLLCGLYAPTEGQILINDIDIKEFNIDEYMNILSVVFQDSVPLAFTVLENVACCPIDDADYDLFWDSVEKAGLKDKIESLPNRELTFVTQIFDTSGIRLSGGETQKLMLARALYKSATKKASLLILDEPTAALDPLSEEAMYLTYDSFADNNTSLFISHRLSSTKFCNRIMYLEDGRILEEGTHKTLLNKNGKYREMFDIQSKYYKEGGEENA